VHELTTLHSITVGFAASVMPLPTQSVLFLKCGVTGMPCILRETVRIISTPPLLDLLRREDKDDYAAGARRLCGWYKHQDA
jgi:hypothetical protein